MARRTSCAFHCWHTLGPARPCPLTPQTPKLSCICAIFTVKSHAFGSFCPYKCPKFYPIQPSPISSLFAAFVFPQHLQISLVCCSSPTVLFCLALIVSPIYTLSTSQLALHLYLASRALKFLALAPRIAYLTAMMLSQMTHLHVFSSALTSGGLSSLSRPRLTS
jgi:hypothetical protein